MVNIILKIAQMELYLKKMKRLDMVSQGGKFYRAGQFILKQFLKISIYCLFQTKQENLYTTTILICFYFK